VSDKQEQAALLLERCRDRLSGHEIGACERISAMGSDGFDTDEMKELQDAVEEAEEELSRAKAALEEAIEEYGDPLTMERDQDTLTRLCTEFADQLT
jgi:hypothetical protein